MTVWTPDDPPRRTVLSGAERRWIDQRTAEATGRPAPSVSRRVHRACDRLRTQAILVGSALHAATVSSPPPKPSSLGVRRGSDPSDPALSAITATHAAIDRGMWRLAHLLDDCRNCPAGEGPGHNEMSDTLASLLDDDWTDTATWLTYGIVRRPDRRPDAKREPSPRQVISQAVIHFDGGARRLADWWRELHNDGAEPDLLADLASRYERLAGRMAGLSTSLAQWTPSDVRTCACTPGCRAPANHGRMNDAHRKAAERRTA